MIARLYPEVKILLVHPRHKDRTMMAEWIRTHYGCSVDCTTNYDRALARIAKEGAGGPRRHYYMVIADYDITSPRKGAREQGAALAHALHDNPDTAHMVTVVAIEGHHHLELPSSSRRIQHFHDTDRLETFLNRLVPELGRVQTQRLCKKRRSRLGNSDQYPIETLPGQAAWMQNQARG